MDENRFSPRAQRALELAERLLSPALRALEDAHLTIVASEVETHR